MTLLEFASLYVNRVGGKPSYLEQMHVLCRRLPWRPQDLTPDRIDAYLTSALKHLAPSTVDNHRRMLRSLMRFAVSEGLVANSIARPLRRVKRNPPNPRAWSHAELASLIAAAEQMPGRTLKAPLNVIMPAWIATAYSTGLRLNDLLAIRWDDIRGQRISQPQQKTSWAHVIYLDDNALRFLKRLPRCGPRIFGDLIGRSRMLVAMRKLVRLAGLSGTTKFCRRSGATYCEINGIDATHYLGHRSPGMKIYYVDRLLLAEERPQQAVVPPLRLVDSTK
jgi:integrase